MRGDGVRERDSRNERWSMEREQRGEIMREWVEAKESVWGAKEREVGGLQWLMALADNKNWKQL